MSYFRRFFCRGGYSQSDWRSSFGLPISAMSQGGIKVLVSGALLLIGLGVLVLIFPLVLAFFVAGLFFLIALFCLQLAWRLYRAGRSGNPLPPDVSIGARDDEEGWS